jgi:hypothetical protein
MKIKKSIYMILLSAGILGTPRSHSLGNLGFGVVIATCIGSHIADKKMQKKEGLAQTAIDLGKSSLPLCWTAMCINQSVSLPIGASFGAQAMNLLLYGTQGTLMARYAGNILSHISWPA